MAALVKVLRCFIMAESERARENIRKSERMRAILSLQQPALQAANPVLRERH